MPLNIYDFTIPNMIQSLTALSAILQKASSSASSKNLDATTLPSTRLADDMHPLTFQVLTACNTAKFVAVRVAGVPNVEMPDTESTLEELGERIQKTIDFLKGVDRAAFDGKDEAEVLFRQFKFTGLTYATMYALPNFYFHVTTTYAILRGKGIELGKLDFLGSVKEFAQ